MQLFMCPLSLGNFNLIFNLINGYYISCPGKCTANTHTGQYVLNKSTKYYRSAGLEEYKLPIIRRSATPPKSG